MQVLILDPHPIMADAIAQVVHRAASSANTVQVATLAALKASLKKEDRKSVV
jgi:HPt (histidine-containing phosphotransfer) domain-containing protein